MIPKDITFAHPWFFLLLLLIPLFLFWKWRKYSHQYPELTLSTLAGFQGHKSWKTVLRPFLVLFKLAAFIALIIALARPQNAFDEENITADGIDIVLVMDISGSMLARDFEPDRLSASKRVAEEFIVQRKFDRVGLVVFAGESFTQCPVTTDQKVLLSLLREIESGIIEDGTAIGMGLATAVNRLKESQAKSKVVVLLTDGVNNQGFIDPLTAAETAQQFGIKVYTIGVGTQGQALYPVKTIMGTRYQYMEVQIDEALLEKIAYMTDGKYFRATDNASLKNIYASIDKLEKTEIDITKVSRYTEQFHLFALFAAACLLLSFVLRNTLFRGIT